MTRMDGEGGDILVVDDNPANLRLLSQMLAKENYKVRAAVNGALALQAAAARQPDLVLLDVNMPGMNGIEVCKRLKADQKTRAIPVIFISALGETEDKLRGFEAGGTDYITKPFIADEVLARLRAHLSFYGLRRRLEERVEENTQALLRAERRRRLVFDNVSEGIYAIDLEGRCILANPACVRLLGFDAAEELLGEDLHALIHHPDGEGQAKPRERDAPPGSGGDPGFGQGEDQFYRRRDGSALPVRRRVVPLVDDQEVVGMVVTFLDITERRRSEKALQESEARFRDLVETSSDWIWEVDAEARYTYSSPKAGELLGYQSEEILGRTPFDFMPPEEARRVSTLYREIVAERKPIERLENINLTREGRRVVLETSGAPVFSAGGRFTGYRGVDRDITTRKKAEEALRQQDEWIHTISQSAWDAIISTDLDGAIKLWNRGAEKIFQYPEAEMLGRPVTTIIPPRLRERHIEAVQQVVNRGQLRLGGQVVEVSGVRRDGKEIPLEVTLATGGHGGDRFFSAVIRDISQRKNMESELLRAKEEADAANRAKSIFLATMSHEIRTPLNAILGMGELLKDSRLSEFQKWCVDTLDRSGETLLALINDILDLSKIEAGQMTLESRSFSPFLLVEEATSLFVFPALEKGISLRHERGEGVPQFVKGDPNRLRQVLLNLIGNAIKFTEKGSVTVRVQGEDDGHLAFTVVDDGPGIPEEKQEEIFQPFAQADFSITRKHGGTGLGLAICRRLVDLMGGRMWLESAVGRGSVFGFTAALSPAQWDDISPTEIKDAEGVGAASAGEDNRHPASARGLKILVVDDAEDNRLLIEAFLKQTPHQLVMAENGADALAKIKSAAFDLVLMDIQMPVMDGYEAIKKIRAWEEKGRRKRIPIAALTAHALAEESERIKTAGCDLHLTKPIRKQRLIDAIDQFKS